MASAQGRGSAAWTEFRRRVASLFAAVEVHRLPEDDLGLAATSHAFDPAAQWSRPQWGSVRPLLGSGGCIGSHHRQGEPGSHLHIALTLHGGTDDQKGRISPPAVLAAHIESADPVSVALVAHPDHPPRVIQPSIARPKRPVVQSLPPSRATRPVVKRVKVASMVPAAPRVRVVTERFGNLALRLHPVPATISYQSPMERKRLPMPPRGSNREELLYGDEMRALASANSMKLEDIRLVGVYLNVPLGAASQMEFDEPTGSLLLALRANASEVVGRLQRPVVTLVLGKVIATGKVVRAFL
ncbi:MAG: hypothetical protein P4L33_21595 [Capsulimonadaceae bacterium]|nr:hypothetical protein [Capsulimonadaceae bacterium]